MTTTKVKPVNKDLLQRSDAVCVEQNNSVFHGALIQSALVEAFSKQNIKTKTISRDNIQSSECEYRVTYVARRSFGAGVYISNIELNLFDRNRNYIGNAKWKINSSLSPDRFKDLQENVDEIVDKLLN
ncbi:hypothetical protein I2F62_03925 [Acinetobacter sp. MD2(2019)]|nr:hypothetical protein [Acinetobacter sp. MD2(2019)]